MKKWKVLITDYEFDDLAIEENVLSKLSHVEFIKGQCRSEDEVIRLAADVDGIINQYAPIGENVIQKLQRCKVISRYGVGVDTIDLRAATEKGIRITNVPDYGVEEVSNHALALLLSWSRKIVQLHNHIRRGNWDFKLGMPIQRYSCQTLGVLGFGRIPRSLVKKARAFGFNIVVYDPFVQDEVIRAEGARPETLEGVLQQSDFISVHIPLTDETKHLLNRDTFKMMKRNAVIINTARGAIIHEQDLLEALSAGEIAGAALDVLETEPIDQNHPLLSLDNVILTPHSAWYSEEAMVELRTKTAQNIVDVLEGKLPSYLVNHVVVELA
ncbi:C-terminal binding protein [Neobacillus sp. NPDC058068]|uniref:C-terminal binding protein n=1 Tax=Neobacillus sp. NPDC058068 TaxID=3346325 RepID=UPI0036DA1D25